MVNIPQASPLCLQISGGAYQQIADTLTIRQLAELPILTIFFFLFSFYHLKPSFSKIITSMAQSSEVKTLEKILKSVEAIAREIVNSSWGG